MLDFKTPKVAAQFNLLPIHNRRLRKVLDMLALYCELEFRKDVVVTEILRTEEENRAVGGIPNSPHCVWNAADIRSSTFEPDEVAKIEKFLNCVTYRNNGKKTFVYHEVKKPDGTSGGLHLHIQCLKDGEK